MEINVKCQIASIYLTIHSIHFINGYIGISIVVAH